MQGHAVNFNSHQTQYGLPSAGLCSGIEECVQLVFGKSASLPCDLANSAIGSIRLLGNLGRLVVAEPRSEYRGHGQRLFHEASSAIRIGLEAANAFLFEVAAHGGPR